MNYDSPGAGGVFEHKPMDCPTHGQGAMFFTTYRGFRDKRPRDPWLCVKCVLELKYSLIPDHIRPQITGEICP